MADLIPIFTGSIGLNTSLDPVRLPFNPDTGVQDLAVAYNVDHDVTGRIGRRKGYAATTRTEDIHSLFCDGGECLFVTGTSLCRLNADYSYTSVATVTTGARVSCVQIHNRVYWANGFERGYVQDGVNHTWEAGTYYGPATTRQYSDPPTGTHLAYHGARVYSVQGNIAWHSEPFNLNAFDLVRNYLPYQTKIRMFRPISTGIWVSTERAIYFLAGLNPAEMQKDKKAEYPAIEWTDCEIDLEDYGTGEIPGTGAIWTSTKGICIGLPSGQMLNLTHKKVDYPDAISGAGLVIGKRYIGLLKP